MAAVTGTAEAERDRADRTQLRAPSLRYAIAVVVAVAFLVGSLLVVSALVRQGQPDAADVPQRTGPQLTVKLAAPATSGPAELQVHVVPVAVLPIPCDALADEPFLNQIILNRPTEVSISVTAAATVTWNLRIQQE